MVERLYPCQENLGKNCTFWSLDVGSAGCNFPKAELLGRTSCEGMIDNVCVNIKDGIVTGGLDAEQQVALRTRTSFDNSLIPPGSN